MKNISLLIALLAVSLRIASAQNGYNYDRPTSAGGFQPQAQGGFPTTPTYQAPAFSPNQPSGQNGYNYPSQADTDFPTAPASGTTGYPSGPQQRPTNVGASSYAPPAVQGGSAAGPYPGQGPAQRPVIGGGSFGGAPAVSGPSGFGQGNIGGGGFQSGPGSVSSSSSSGGSSSGQQDENQEGDYSAIPGEPDVDYPIYSEIPETSFDCNQQEYPGYYADVEARCQVFHICALNKTFNFLCPNGTIFSQETLVCVWWNQFDCNSAPGLYANNANLYDNTQTGQQAGPGAVANDFAGPTGAAGPYPAPGRPQTPSFGSTGPTGPNAYQPSAPSAGGNYPTAQGPYPSAGGPQAPQGPYPSGQNPPAQGPYPSATGPSNVPSSYQPPQGDTSYPAPGVPQTQTTPSRDYLPPRRG
ncbi:spidroin-2-like [Chironomus tepperi]|uniref:spidroin-2-like n=1 Tax=Chironomus tepperi TaxID=113505 RepID=UPI00391F45DC